MKKTSSHCLHTHTNQIVTVIQLVHNYQGSTSKFLENLLQSVSEIWPPPFIKEGQLDSYNQESNLMKVSDISAFDVASGHKRLTIYVIKPLESSPNSTFQLEMCMTEEVSKMIMQLMIRVPVFFSQNTPV